MHNLPIWMSLYNQLDLFDSCDKLMDSRIPLTSSNTKILVGQYFELLTSMIFRSAVKCTKLDRFAYDFVIWGGEKRKRDIIIEVKAANKQHMIDQRQMKHYEEIIAADFPFTKPKVYYVLFCYAKGKRLTSCGSAYNLLNAALPESVKAVAVVPFEFMKGLVSKFKINRYGKWGNGDRLNYIRLPMTIFSAIMSADVGLIRHTLGGYCGTEAAGYSFYKVNLPKLKVLNAEIKSFPVIFIDGKADRCRLGAYLK